MTVNSFEVYLTSLRQRFSIEAEHTNVFYAIVPLQYIKNGYNPHCKLVLGHCKAATRQCCADGFSCKVF